VDEDGYEVDSEDDDERVEEAAAAAAEFDPYSDVKIEYLLAPLTAASDLPNHPTLARPFTSRILTELTEHAGEMLQKERASLWNVKHLLTRMSGDNTWIPCESVETPNDFDLFIDERDRGHGRDLGKTITQGWKEQVSTGTLSSEEAATLTVDDTAEESALTAAKALVSKLGADQDVVISSPGHEAVGVAEKAPEVSSKVSKGLQNNKIQDELQDALGGDSMDIDEAIKALQDVEDDGELAAEADELGPDDLPAPHRMRTRARAAKAASDNTGDSRTRSLSPDSGSESYVHPFFLASQASHPDRNVGLPAHEADETRRVLQLYVQKQEEVVRGVQKVYDGLLRADRYRKLVMKWAKAEAHVGVNRDMSDGEDWYDKEEWGLEEDLKKGQDEEEDADAATTAKKTRARRQ